MPTGVQLQVPVTPVPTSTAAAEAVIPQRQLYEQTQQVQTQVNAVQQTASYFQAAVPSLPGGQQTTQSTANAFNAAAQGATLDYAQQAAQAATTAATQATAANTAATTAATQATAANTQATTAATQATAAATAAEATAPSPTQTWSEAPGDTAVNANTLVMSGWVRYLYNPNFLLHMTGGDQVTPYEPIGDYGIGSANPGDNLANESDLEMLTRLYPAPGSAWAVTAGLYGVRPWSQVDIAEYGAVFCYAPLVPSGVGSDSMVMAFYHLWDYTPSSGPPTRNGIADFMSMMAAIPVKW